MGKIEELSSLVGVVEEEVERCALVIARDSDDGTFSLLKIDGEDVVPLGFLIDEDAAAEFSAILRSVAAGRSKMGGDYDSWDELMEGL